MELKESHTIFYLDVKNCYRVGINLNIFIFKYLRKRSRLERKDEH